MKTQKIRIGNDIRIAVDLRLYLYKNNNLREREVYNPGDSDFENIDSNPFVNKKYEVYYPNQYKDGNNNDFSFEPEGTPINIRSVKAILINTSKQKERADYLKKKSRFIARFPIEPTVEAFSPTPYDVCNGGYPTWRAYPRRYYFAPYHGFGVYPHWHGIYKPLPMVNDTEYIANVMATEKQNVVEVSFPAEDQMYLGTYTLVVVAKVFAPGYNQHNLKTVTIDIPNVFELVKTTAEGVDGDILGSAYQVDEKLPSYDLFVDRDIYVKGGDVVKKEQEELTTGDYIQLKRTDGEDVNVDLSSVVSWADPDKNEV